MKLTNNNNIFCSVSAGYSSVLMAIMMKEWYPDHNIINVMANPSKERHESLEFMDKCDKVFGLNLKWIEAEIDLRPRKGTKFNVVTYEKLKVNGEIFEEGIKKYGVPSVVNKWCTRELKLVPMKKYADSVFGKNNYSIAVGIRADEIDRVRKDYKTNNVFYPLIDNNVTSKERNEFWSKQDIQITIEAYEGNCDMCFEKSDRKLYTLIQRSDCMGNWWQDMMNKYSHKKIAGKDAYNDFIDKYGGMFFYRKNRTMDDLRKESKIKKFKPATNEYIYEGDIDKESDCGAGCQVF